MKSLDTFRAQARRIYAESEGTRWLSALCSLIGCIQVGISFLFIWITKLIVDAAVAPGGHIPAGLVAALIGCLLAQLGVPALRRRLETVAYVRYVNRLRLRLFRHLLRECWSGRASMHTGDAMGRIDDDVASLAALTCTTIPGILAVSLQLVGAFVFLAFLNTGIALSVVFIMPVALLVSKVYIKKTRELNRLIRNQESGLMNFLQESLRHRTLLSTLMNIGRRVGAYDRRQWQLSDTQLKRIDISIFSSSAITFGFMAGYVVTFLWSAFGLASGAVTFGMMTAFLQLVSQVQRPAVDLSRRIPAFITASVALERIDEILDAPLENLDLKEIPKAPLGLRLDGMTFRYRDGKKDVISSLSYDFRPGSVTAVVGHTGVGKSTLLRVILGLVSPTSGSAEVYGVDGRALPVSPGLRRYITYVPQGNSLMSGTVRENLLLAAPEATDEEMRCALKAASADFVLALPDGLDTECSEGGTGFSEGQAQRIAIARGLLKKGSLILLDEPTSSLDPATEEALMKSLAEYLPKDSTVIIVTHRESTLSYCSGILRLDRADEELGIRN